MRDKTLDSKIQDLTIKETEQEESVFTGESYDVAGLNFITAPIKAAKKAAKIAKEQKLKKEEKAEKLREEVQEESIQPQTNDPVVIKEKSEQEIKQELETATENKIESEELKETVPDNFELSDVDIDTKKQAKAQVKKLDIESKTVDEIVEKINLVKSKGKPTGTPKKGKKAFNYEQILAGDANAVLEAFAENIDYKKINVNNFMKDTEKVMLQYGLGKELIEYLKKGIKYGQEFQFRQGVAAQALPNILKQVNDIANKYSKNPGSEKLREELILSSYHLAQIVKLAKGNQTLSGQNLAILNAARKPISMDDVKKLIKDPNVSEDIRWMSQGLFNLGTDANRLKLIEKGSLTQWSKKAMMSTYISGLLSYSGTHFINLTSQSFFTLMHFGERLAAASLGGLSRNADKVYFGEVTALMAGARAAFVDSLKLAGKAFKTNESAYEKSLLKDRKLSDVGSADKYGVPSNKNLRAEDYGFNGALGGAMNFYSNVATLFGGRLLLSADDFFKGILYRMELHALAYRKAAIREKELLDRGVEPQKAYDDAIAYQVDLISNPTDEISFDAQEFAKIGTFQNKLKGAMAKVSDAVNNSTLLKAAAPFIDTPTNIVSQTLQRSPFAGISRQWREDLAAGGARRQLAIAKMGIGFGVMYGIQDLASSGRITGKGPGDTELRQTMMRDGWRPYHIRFLKKEGYSDKFLKFLDKMAKDTGVPYSISKEDKTLYIPIRYIEPLSGVMAMGVDYYEYAQYEDDPGKIRQVALGAVAGLYNYTSNHPFLALVGDMFETLGSYLPHRDVLLENLINKVVKTSTLYTAYGLPTGVWSSLQAGLNRQILDPLQRDWSVSPDTPPFIKGFYEAFNYIRSRTPGLSQTLPPKLDVFGRVKNSRNKVYPALGYLGIRLSQDEQGTVDKMFRANGIGLKEPRNIAIKDTQVSGGPRQSGQRIFLTAQQKNTFIKIMNTERLPFEKKDGTTVNLNFQQALIYVMKNEPFTDLEMNDIEEKRAIIQSVYREYFNLASYKMWQTDPSLTEELDKKIERVEKDANRLPPSAARGFIYKGDEKRINEKIDQMTEK